MTTLQTQRPLPRVSLLTPTFNRQRFLSQLLRCVMAQDYPHDLMQWVMVDAGERTTLNCPFLEIFSSLAPGPQAIGAMRNQTIGYANGDVMVNLDDDDYYSSGYVRHAVDCALQTGLAGMSQRIDYDPALDRAYAPFPYYANYSAAGNMAFTRDYLRDNRFGESRNSEERMFTRKFTAPMFQMDMLAVGILHARNTGNTNRHRSIVDRTLEDLIHDEPSRQFYRGMRNANLD